jgi:hypothetical protein
MIQDPRASRPRHYDEEYKSKIMYVLNAIYNQCKETKHSSLYDSAAEKHVGKNVAYVIIRDYTKKMYIRKHIWTARIPDDLMVEEVIESSYRYGREKNLNSLNKKIEAYSKAAIKPPSETTFNEWCEKTSKIEFHNDDELSEYIFSSDTTDPINHRCEIPGGMPEEKTNWVKEHLLNGKYKPMQITPVFVETEDHIAENVVGERELFLIECDRILKDVKSKYKEGTNYVPLTVEGKVKTPAFRTATNYAIPTSEGNSIDSIAIKDERGTYYYANKIYATREKVVPIIPVEKKQPELISCTPVKSNPQPVQTILEMSTEESDKADKRIAEALNKPVKIKKAVSSEARNPTARLKKGADHDIDKEFVPEQGQSLIATEKKKEIIKEISILWGAFKFKVYGNK